MKMKILTVALIFCMNLNGFAQNKKEDDNKPCTRGELAQLIVDTLPWVKELPDAIKEEIKFKDVDTVNPNCQSIITLCEKLSCDPSFPFRPNDLLTRWELGVIITKTVSKIEKAYNIEIKPGFNYWNSSSQLKDIPMCPSWAIIPVTSMIEKGIIQGYPNGTFKGKQPATIKEVKLVLQRIKEKTEALLKEKESQNKPPLESSPP